MQLHKTAFGATNIVASRLACEVGNVRGYFRGSTADRWLQLHDASQLPADAAVPVWSMPLYQTAYFSWDWPKLRSLSNGCVFAISTTEATLTISVDVADFYIDGTASVVLNAPSVVGDLATERASLDLFTAPSILYQAKVKFSTDNGIDVWALMFNVAFADVAALAPIHRHKFETGREGLWRTFSFGRSGLLLPKCCILASASPTEYLSDDIVGDEFLIEGVYKAV